MKNAVSCVIPAYNEGPRIEEVLSCVQDHTLIDEVIVIDDGSSDNTREIVKTFKKIKLVSHKKNKGKSYAVMRGIELSKHQIILLLDADLKNLSKEDVSMLLNPVLNNQADTTLSIRSNDFLIFKLLGINSLSGERVFHKSLIENYKDLEHIPGFGLEAFINERVLLKRAKIKSIKWENIENTRKHEKIGFVRGTLGDIKTAFDVFKTVGIFYWLYQAIKMRGLIRND